jgi:hypothetical protein
MNKFEVIDEKTHINENGEKLRCYTAKYKDQKVKVRIVGEPSKEAIEEISKVFYRRKNIGLVKESA